MSYNIAGIITNNAIDVKEILENLTGNKFTFIEEVSFEDACSNFRDESTIDIFCTDAGSLVFFELGRIFDISGFKNEVVQFMVSDLTDTFYFEMYESGILKRKYVSRLGDVIEDKGSGIIDDDTDLMDTIWEIAEKTLRCELLESKEGIIFKRYDSDL